MAQEIPETTYVPEAVEDTRKERERRAVQDGTELWRRRKEELQRQKHREQREVCVVNGLLCLHRHRSWSTLPRSPHTFSFISGRYRRR